MMKKFFLFAFAALALAACSDDDNSTPAPKPGDNDKYQGGFYVLNEGSYGRTPASINYYDPAAKIWTLNLFQINNGKETLGITGTVAVCDDENMYIVSKGAPCLVKVGLSDFVKKASVDEEPDGAQARSFALIDDKRGVLTTSQSAYIVSLDDLSLTTLYEGSTNALSGDVAVAGNTVFLIDSSTEMNAVLAIDAKTLKVLKRVGTATTGFAQAGNAIWAGNGEKLVKIDPTNLTSQEFPLGSGLSIYFNPNFTPTGLHASKRGDALYFVNAQSEWVGLDVYKYTLATGDVTKLFEAPLIGNDQYSAYGSCINVNPRTGDLYLVYAKNYGSSANIYIADGETGLEKEMIPYTDQEYWYPSMLIFR